MAASHFFMASLHEVVAFIYLFELSKVCKSAFYMLGYTGDHSSVEAFKLMIKDSPTVTKAMRTWLALQ